jgi:hypothetical protein
MVGEDTVRMSMKELKRVYVIRQAMAKARRQREAGEVPGVTARQVRRLIQRVRVEGDAGLVHRSRGRPSNGQRAPALKARVLRLYATHDGDVGPTLAVEKLAERHGITLSAETLGGWLQQQGIEHFARCKRPHRAWRARKAHAGALLQMDGSHHAWFEERGPTCVLMAYIDDASSRVLARFYEYEGTVPAMDSFGRYVRCYGVPLCAYADKHTTYRAPGEPTVAEQLAGTRPQSQFERGARRTGSDPDPCPFSPGQRPCGAVVQDAAGSPGERPALAGIASIEAANRFLETWLPRYNRRFAVQPAEAADLHRPSPTARELDRMLCLKTTRVVRRDWTVAHHRHLYQLETTVRATQVVVEERLDGTIEITHHGRPLRYHAITARPVKVTTPPSLVTPRPPVKPTPHHPWRKRLWPDRHQHAAAAKT